MEKTQGWCQGVVKLSDNRQMMCVGNDKQTKLVAMSHEFENHLGKQVSINLNSEGTIISCTVNHNRKNFNQLGINYKSISRHENITKQAKQSLESDLSL